MRMLLTLRQIVPYLKAEMAASNGSVPGLAYDRNVVLTQRLQPYRYVGLT